MNIDKFGHHIHKRMRLSEIFDVTDKALTKNESGDFDLQFARLKGVKAPVAGDDVVNKDYVDQTIKSFYTKVEVQSLLAGIKTDMQVILHQFTRDFYTKANIEKILSRTLSK